MRSEVVLFPGSGNIRIILFQYFKIVCVNRIAFWNVGLLLLYSSHCVIVYNRDDSAFMDKQG